MVTVNDILKTKTFSNCKVLAGHNGLSRSVSSITVSEVPDASNWLRGSEVVCTTFFVSDHLTSQVEWIKSISNKATALVINSNRFHGIIPQQIIEVCNQFDLPLIEIPPETTWRTVIESVMNLLTDDKVKIIQRSEKIHSDLMELVLQDKPIQTIVDTISSLTGNPIIVEDIRMSLIASSDISEIDRHDSKIFEHRRSEPFRGKLTRSSFFKGALQGRKNDRWMEKLIYIDGERDVKNITIPILSNEVVYGFISLLDFNREHSTIDLIALEHGATALALKLAKQMMFDQVDLTNTLNFINDLIHGRIRPEMTRDPLKFNIDWSKPMIVVLMDVKINIENKMNQLFLEDSESSISNILKKHLNSHTDKIIIGNKESFFTILMPFPVAKLNVIVKNVKEKLNLALLELEQEYGDGSVKVGIGGAYHDFRLLEKSYNDATTALSMAKLPFINSSIVVFKEHGIQRILSMITTVEELKNFSNDYLSELKRHDKENKDILCETLRSYLKCNGNITRTAQELFVHPNTIPYRLKKIKKIINDDLNSAEMRFAYLFALEANMQFKS